MIRDRRSNDYFNWLYDTVCEKRQVPGYSHYKLLTHLHNTEFRYLMTKDRNRSEDGIELRSRYGIDDDSPCSVLEMMVALAIRCETDIMDDPEIGDRAAQWFWGMIVNLGLGSMHDSRYDEEYVDEVLERFLDRDYEPDGTGGLFRINRCERDLRNVEIWIQMLWYLDSIT